MARANAEVSGSFPEQASLLRAVADSTDQRRRDLFNLDVRLAEARADLAGANLGLALSLVGLHEAFHPSGREPQKPAPGE